MTDYSIKDIGKAAVQCAKDEWKRVVRDPEDAERIKHYHRVTGAGWALDGGEYEEYEDFWCGVFAAYCFRKAGDYLEDDHCVDITLKESVSGYLFPSTTRLAGRWKPWSEFNVPGPEIIDPTNIQVGDIVLVSTGRTDRTWGDHVCLAAGPPKDEFVPTYEGNSTSGELGNHESGEGVTFTGRSFEEIAVVYRLRLEHFILP